MTVRVLFVCWANACRSPMSHALATGQVRERGLDIEVDSAAGVRPASYTSPEAVRAIATSHPGWEEIIDGRAPKSIHDVEGSPEVVVVHAPDALIHCEERFPSSNVLPLYVDDPVGRGQDYYDACCRELEVIVSGVLDDITSGRLPDSA